MNLQEMLSDGVRYAPHYRPVSNSDHLPMALSAMSGLGATTREMEDFRRAYVKRLHEWGTGPGVGHWRDGVGQLATYPALMNTFRSQITQEGRDSVVKEALSILLPALAMDAFHPIIRLGYAVDFNSSDEMAAALAYMAVTHREVPISGKQVDLHKVVEQQVTEGKIQLRSTRFGDSIAELIESGRYPVGSAKNLGEIATVALDIYLSTRNFFALHLVTATQAMRCCVPEELKDLAVQSMTGAILASHLVLGSPAMAEQPTDVPIQLDPEHAYKYAWACLSEYRCYGDDRYLEEFYALRAAGLVPAWDVTR